MLKILQARLQQYVNQKLPDVQAGFRTGRGDRDQIANILWIIRKAKEFQKNMYFCFIDYTKAFDYENHNKLWKIFKEMGIPDHFICLLKNLYANQEATIRTGHGTKDWFQTGKGVHQGLLYSSLDCKEIKPANPKGNHSRIFIGRTDAEAETPILWPPDGIADSLEKTIMLGKIEGRRRKG